MSVGKSKTLNMTEGNPLTIILMFAIPMILSNLFQQFYSLIDGIIVGQLLGTDAFAAVASASSITAVFVQLASGLALGGSIVISQYFGAGKTDKIAFADIAPSEMTISLVKQGENRFEETVYHPKGIETGHQLWYNFVGTKIKTARR